MKCPNCDGKVLVVNTFCVGESVYRLRKCSNRATCGWLLTTHEQPCDDQYVIYKLQNERRKAQKETDG